MSVFRRFAGSSLLVGLTTVVSAGCGMSEPDVQTSSTVVEPVNFVDRVGTPINGNLETAAIDFVKSTADMTASDRDSWKVRSVKRGKDGRDHVRLDQVYAGIKVWGADVVVHADETSLRGVDGIVAKSIDDHLVITPKLDATKAIAIAKALYDASIADRSAPLAYSRESAELVVYPGPKGTARLAWHTEFFTELQAGKKPGLWNNIIAADSGEVLESFNAIHTLSQASGPGGNPKVPRTWVDALDVEPATGTDFQMNTARLVTVNMNGSDNDADPGTIVTGPLAAIGDAPINDAHGFAEATLNMMSEWFGHNSIDDEGFVIRSRVHYGVAFENAFWDGTQMTYGDGASTFYPLSGAVDVVAHEISHGYTEFHSDLIYSGESGGSNEAFSDIAGAVGEFFIEGATGDFDVGEDIFRAQNEALRYMCDPPRDGISIDDYADFTPGMDVHFSSGIPNKAFCHAARRFSGGSETSPATVDGVRRVATAWYEANASYWTAGTTFRQACRGILSAAGALGFSETEIGYLRTSWDDVGVLNCDGPTPLPVCDETLTAESGTVQSAHPYVNNFTRTWCIRPASGAPATLTFTAFNTEQDWDFVTVYDGNVGGDPVGTYHGNANVPNEPPADEAIDMPPPATSSYILMRLTTDTSVVRSGFTATWSTNGEPPPNQAPTVSITAPSNGSTVFGTVNVTATAADVDGTVASVVFTLPDGTTVTDSAAPYETTWVSSTVANGNYPITAVATDDDGETGNSTVTVTVNNIPCTSDVFTSTDVPLAIPDFDTTGITSALPVVGNGVVASLRLSLNIQHTYQGDLAVFLVSPSGARYRIHYRTGGTTDNLIVTDREIPAAVGQTLEGNWSLEVSDRARVDRGSLTAWSLNVVGRCQ
jgi:vibriolysin